MVILVGKEKRVAKDGTRASVLHFTEEFVNRDNCVGSRAFSEYIKGNFDHIAIGEVVDLVYRKGYQDKAFLADVR